MAIAALLLFIVSNSANSADIPDADIVPFSPNTPVMSGDFNQNFDVIKGAVNTKQDKITGCNPGFYMETVAANGTATCKPVSTGMAAKQGLPAVSTRGNLQNITTLNVTPPSSGLLMVSLTAATRCGDAFDGFFPSDIQFEKTGGTTLTSPVFPVTGMIRDNYDGTNTVNYSFAVTPVNTTITVKAGCNSFNGSIEIKSLISVFSPNDIQTP